MSRFPSKEKVKEMLDQINRAFVFAREIEKLFPAQKRDAVQKSANLVRAAGLTARQEMIYRLLCVYPEGRKMSRILSNLKSSAPGLTRFSANQDLRRLRRCGLVIFSGKAGKWVALPR